MLAAEINDFGQLVATVRFLAHTAPSGVSPARARKPQRRLVSRPASLHLSHFHAAWSEN